MGLADVLNRRVRARKDDTAESQATESSSLAKNDSIFEDESIGNETEGMVDHAQEKDTQSEDSGHDQSEESSSPDSSAETLNQISFGALISAQSSLNLKRKRSSTPQPARKRALSPFAEALERKAGKKDHRTLTRPSKHAPTEISSKKAVSRKRSIVAPPTIAHRDPRFNNLSGTLDTNKVAANYAFLNDYRKSELAALKSTIRNTKDPVAKEVLKKELLVMNSKEKARKDKEIQQAVLREHRSKEKEAVKSGKQPFYLKRGEQKKLALVKKFEGLGEKKVERIIARRTKKKSGKERKNMPAERREA